MRFKLVQFTVDNTPPVAPALVSPGDNLPINGTSPIANDWEDVADAVHYIYQSYNVDSNGDCILSPVRFTDTYNSSQTNSRVLPDGLTYCWQVKAVDASGNESPWSDLWKTVADNSSPDTPTANLAAGIYTGTQFITLESNDGGSGVENIYYTTDGSEPTNGSNVYSSPIEISTSTTIKAIAYDKAGNASGVFSALYEIAPLISGEGSIDVTTTSITLIWTTDHPSTSRVVYDTTPHSLGAPPNYGYAFSTAEDTNKVLTHSVTINGLTPGTTYYFRTVSHGSPESVSNEITAITKIASSSNNGIPVFRVFSAATNNSQQAALNQNGQNAADNPQVLGANDNPGDDNPDDNEDNGEVQGTSTSAAEGTAANENNSSAAFSWWWLLILLGLIAGVYWLIARNKKQEEAS